MSDKKHLICPYMQRKGRKNTKNGQKTQSDQIHTADFQAFIPLCFQ
jgi:hypothetical protein